MAVCMRYTRTIAEAEDIFHEAIVKVFEKVGELRDPEAFDSWAKSSVVRTAINYFNRTTRQELLNVPLEKNDLEFENEDFSRIVDQLAVDELLGMINSLPSKYRVAINLYLIDGYSHLEIASMLSITESASRSQYMRGRRLLIAMLQKTGIIENEI